MYCIYQNQKNNLHRTPRLTKMITYFQVFYKQKISVVNIYLPDVYSEGLSL